MLFSDIYQKAILSKGADPDLTPEKLAPVMADRFKLLWDNKIIYHHRVTMILTLLETNITQEKMQFKARREKFVLDHSNHRHLFADRMPEEWSFSTSWLIFFFSRTGLGAYSNWTFWADPNLVRKMIELSKQNDY